MTGRRFAFVATAAALPLLFVPTKASAQVSVAEARSYLESAAPEMEAMATFFGWNGKVERTDEGALDTNAERVSLDPGEIARLLGSMGGHSSKAVAVRMIVAHEVWHFVEHRLGTLKRGAADSDARRISECRADIMAARYLASTDRYYSGDSLESSPAGGIARDLWTKTTTDHPTPRQRQRAAQFGSLTVLREQSGTSPALKQAIDLRLGIRDGESLEPWSRRACEQIVHAQKIAVNQLLVTQPVTTQRDGESVFRMTYTNNSARHVEVSATVTALYYGSVDESPARAEKSWSFPQRLRIEPGRSAIVEGKLAGLGTPAGPVYYQVAPDAGDALLSARFVAGPATQSEWAIAPGLPAADTAFALAIQALANDAPNGFSQFRGGGASKVGSTLVVDSTLEIPGARGTSISIEDSGGSYVGAALFSGDSAAEAESALRQTRERMARIWPSAKFDDSRPGEFLVKVSRYSQVHVWLLKNEYGNTLHLTLRPRLLGLMD